jgi:hypothetical protein
LLLLFSLCHLERSRETVLTIILSLPKDTPQYIILS